jgi:hypothetical protein
MILALVEKEPWWRDPAALAWIGIGIALLTGGVTAFVTMWVARRRTQPHPEFVKSLDVTPLLTTVEGEDAGRLKVAYDGALIADPHLARLRVSCRSEKEIPSDWFDRGKPFILDLGVPIGALIGNPFGSAVEETRFSWTPGGQISIRPYLISNGIMLEAKVITEGRPHIEYRGKPRDVEVHTEGVDDNQTTEADLAASRWRRRFKVAVGICFMSGVLIDGFFAGPKGKLAAPWSWLFPCLMLPAIYWVMAWIAGVIMAALRFMASIIKTIVGSAINTDNELESIRAE